MATELTSGASSSRMWTHHLSNYVQRETGKERRAYLYNLSIELGISETTVRHRLQSANGEQPIPPPLYPSPRGPNANSKSVPARIGRPIRKQRASKLTKDIDRQVCPVHSINRRSDEPSDILPERTDDHLPMAGDEDRPIDLCDSGTDEPAPSPCKSTLHRKGRPSKKKEHTKPSGAQTLNQFLSHLGLTHLVPVFRDAGYTTRDDVEMLRKAQKVTLEAVLKAIRKDKRILLRDWHVLHAALHDST